jgi:hypothetical protein
MSDGVSWRAYLHPATAIAALRWAHKRALVFGFGWDTGSEIARNEARDVGWDCSENATEEKPDDAAQRQVKAAGCS